MKRPLLQSSLIALMLLFSIPSLFAQDKGAREQGIQFFEGSWSDVIAAAAEQNKLIFVDAYTVWCGPCKWMSANIFPDPEVGKFHNEHFINYKFDMEKGEGRSFARSYHVSAYPTLLYIDAKGKVQHRVMGAKKGPDLIQEGEKALKTQE